MSDTKLRSRNTMKKLYVLLFLVALTGALSATVWLPFDLKSHDMPFHLSRIYHNVLALENGEFLPPIYPYLYDGMGYATSLFYCDVFLIIPILLSYAGLSVLTAYKIYLVILTFAVLACSYWCGKKFFEDTKTGIVVSVVYSASCYYFTDAFLRGAVGETQAFVFFPFVALGMYNAVYGDKKDILPLCIGFTGMVLSHNLSLAISAILFVVFLLVNLPRLLKEFSRILYIVKAVVYTLCISAFFFLPMAEQLLTQDFLSGYHIKIWNPIRGAVRIRELFFSKNIYRMSLDNFQVDFYPYLGPTIAAIIVCSAAILLVKKKSGLEKFLSIAFVLTGVLLVCVTSIFPWLQLDPYLNAIQFPWRLFLFVTGFAALLAGYLYTRLAQKVKVRGQYVALILVVLISLVQYGCYMCHGIKEFELVDRTTSEYDYETEIVTAFYDEMYFHANTNRNYVANRLDYIDEAIPLIENGVETSYSRDYHTRCVAYTGNTGANSIELPAVYYLGYTATDDQTGERLELTPSEAHGYVLVNIGEKESGSFTVRYTGTALQHISPYITLAFVGYLLVSQYVKKKKAIV